MRTTVRLDEHLLSEVKKYAADSGRTLTSVLEDALRDMLARRTAQARRKPVRLRTYKGAGTQPGIDLDDSAALLEAMESGRQG
jgi:ribosomal protein L13